MYVDGFKFYIHSLGDEKILDEVFLEIFVDSSNAYYLIYWDQIEIKRKSYSGHIIFCQIVYEETAATVHTPAAAAVS